MEKGREKEMRFVVDIEGEGRQDQTKNKIEQTRGEATYQGNLDKRDQQL